jgi:hypothetical protein
MVPTFNSKVHPPTLPVGGYEQSPRSEKCKAHEGIKRSLQRLKKTLAMHEFPRSWIPRVEAGIRADEIRI